MIKVTILLLLFVQVLSKNPAPDNPYPGQIKEKIIYNPSIPIALSGGTTDLKPNDYRVVKTVNFLINHINSHFAGDDEGELLEFQEMAGKVELKVIDEHQRMPHERPRFIKNIYTFEKIIGVSRNGHTGINLHGSVSLTFDPDEEFVDGSIFVTFVIRNNPIPYKERRRRYSIPLEIDDEKNENHQRRHSFKF